MAVFTVKLLNECSINKHTNEQSHKTTACSMPANQP